MKTRINTLTLVDGPCDTYEMAKEMGDDRTLLIVRATVDHYTEGCARDPEAPGAQVVGAWTGVMVWIEAYGVRRGLTAQYEGEIEARRMRRNLGADPVHSQLIEDVSDVLGEMESDIEEQLRVAA